MLNHVERGRVLEQPAREHLAPGQLAFGIGALFDEDLNEGPGLSRLFPRQGPLAAGQANHHVANPLGLARLDHHVLADVVALVEQAQRGHAVFHRRPILALYHGCSGLGPNGLGNVRCRGIGSAAVIAGGQQPEHAPEHTKGERTPHDQASGLHAS